MTRHLFAPLALALVATSASCISSDPMDGTLADNVATSFAACSANEIKFLATKHNFQLAFRECSDNNITAYRWSPDGTQLYFQLVLTPYVMDASVPTKPIGAVPTTTPIGPGAWVAKYRLVLPVGPDETGTSNRLAVYDREQQTVFHTDTPLTEVRGTQRSGDPNAVLMLGKAKTEAGEKGGLWRVDTASGQVTPAFSWLDDVPDTFTYQPALDVVVLGRGEKVSVHQGSDGLVIGTWPKALRGSMHPSGRYLMLEHKGEPISIFYQRAWDELSDEARERELRRLKRFEEGLPEGTPSTVQPPTLSWVDLHSGERWMMDSAYGDSFQWYEAIGHYGAFFLWGFEGKQFKRNVALGSFDGRFLSLDKGRDVLGVTRMEDGEDPTYKPPTGVVPTEGTDEDGSEDATDAPDGKEPAKPEAPAPKAATPDGKPE